MRIKAPLSLQPGDRARLETMAGGDGTPARRARIVLLAATGLPNTVIAERTATAVPTVRLWRRRYEAGGIDALADRERSGRPRTVGDAEIVLRALGGGRSSRHVAAELGVSSPTVLDAWRRYGLRPWLDEPPAFATVPPLDARIAGITGFYLDLPHRAVALDLADGSAHVVCTGRTREIEAWAPVAATFHAAPPEADWDDLIEIFRSIPETKETFRSDPAPAAFAGRLGFLLKHAYLRHVEESARALAPLGINGRELALLALFAAEPLSQTEAAGRLGVDPTTMVTLVDALEARGLLRRRRSARDRRRNLVEPTTAGGAVLARGERVRRDLEDRFLEPLGEDGPRLIQALQVLAVPAHPTSRASIETP
ncbi:helix-turn-helix domain-containing protein [Spirillospora sp. NPDC047279]|uniref:helix-turn-helix domain-containing protein n=1 Tax=Spirillospora sp. NPDC047279 TaxID=3155478 RepID=UPI0033E4B682